MSNLLDGLEFVRNMHNQLRFVCPEPSTPEGRFVNENTVVRLAAMMEGQKLKPEGPMCDRATAAEKTVRVLFMFRHLIVHGHGRLDLYGRRRTCAERESYAWFADCHRDAKVREGCALGLAADGVIKPLIDACKQYYAERSGEQGC